MIFRKLPAFVLGFTMIAGAASATPQYKLSDVTGSTGVVFQQDAGNTKVGARQEYVGDINGDGSQDFVLLDGKGTAYLVFGGQDFSAGVNLDSGDSSKVAILTNSTAYTTIDGVYPAGDFNGDGVDDFFMSIDNNTVYSVVVVFGHKGAWPVTQNLEDLNGTNGTRITDTGHSDQGFSMGDVNGDGADDIVFNTPNRDVSPHTAAGGAYLVMGSTGPWAASQSITSITHTDFQGTESIANAGTDLAVGDVNGDGREDVLISTPNYTPASGPTTPTGGVYVVYGPANGAWPAEVTLGNYTGTRIDGWDNSSIGSSIASGFDFNGDGIDDIAVRTYKNGSISGAGTVYLITGRSNFPATYDLQANLANVLTFNGLETNDALGYNLSSVGDVNGDGKDDLIMGRHANTYSSAQQVTGVFDVVYGSTTTTGTFDLSALNGTNGFEIAGVPAPATGGPYSVFDLGQNRTGGKDINHDGRDDMLLGGVLGYDANGQPFTNSAYVFNGPAAPVGSVAALSGAVLPAARSGYVGGPDITAFMTVINGGTGPAANCSITAPSGAPISSLSFAETDPATNVITGGYDAQFGLAAGKSRSFVLGMTPQSTTPGVEVFPQVTCDGGVSLSPISGVNGIFLTIGNAAGPDILSISATNGPANTVNIPGASGTGYMSIAALNNGVGDGSTGNADEASVKVSVDTGSASLPVNLFICETDNTGACTTPLTPSVNSVIGSGASTYAVFAAGTGTGIPFDAANNRIFVRFKSLDGNTTYSVTSAALQTTAD